MSEFICCDAAKILGSAGCQPVAFGSLPNAPRSNLEGTTNKRSRQAAANDRLPACAPQKKK